MAFLAINISVSYYKLGFDGSVSKDLPVNAEAIRDVGSITGSGRS